MNNFSICKGMGKYRKGIKEILHGYAELFTYPSGNWAIPSLLWRFKVWKLAKSSLLCPACPVRFTIPIIMTSALWAGHARFVHLQTTIVWVFVIYEERQYMNLNALQKIENYVFHHNLISIFCFSIFLLLNIPWK